MYFSSCTSYFQRKNYCDAIYCYRSVDSSIFINISKNFKYRLESVSKKYYVTTSSEGVLNFIGKNKFVLNPHNIDYNNVPYTLDRNDHISGDSITIVTVTNLDEYGTCYLSFNGELVELNSVCDTIRIPYSKTLSLQIVGHIIKEFNHKPYSPITRVCTDTIFIIPRLNEVIKIETTPLIFLPMCLNIEKQRVQIYANSFDLTIDGRLIPFKRCN
jgi:hypothetical protein